jgi:hypothetical protein
MRTLTEQTFLGWAEDHGLGLDPQYPKSAVLTFASGSGDSRFWCIPPEPERRPYYLASLLDLLGDWQSCFAWRHLGYWPNSDDMDAGERVEHQILRGLGLPLGTTEVIEFAPTDRDILLTLLFTTTVFGWSVGQDLYVVPDHTRYVLQTDHHDVVHVDFRDPSDIERWVTTMAGHGFPLPERLPDESFKQPPWMQPG